MNNEKVDKNQQKIISHGSIENKEKEEDFYSARDNQSVSHKQEKSEFYSIEPIKSVQVQAPNEQIHPYASPINENRRANSMSQDIVILTNQKEKEVSLKRTETDHFASPLGVEEEESDEEVGGFFENLLNGKVLKEVKNRASFLSDEIKKEFNMLDDKFKEGLSASKEKLDKWIKAKVEEVVLQLLQQLRPQLQETLKDPYMLECVKEFIDDAVDEIWPGIEDEVLLKLRLKIQKPYSADVNKKPQMRCCFLWPWQWLKQWYLYSVEPYDKSFWEQIKTFSWWFFFGIRLIPFYGVNQTLYYLKIQQFFYAFVFIMIDKDDEYQLINFILNFKKMQFLTIGGFGGVFGYFVFYSCSNVSELSDPTKFNECNVSGPGIFLNVWTDMLAIIQAFIIQISLIYMSFLLLPCSSPKGKIKFMYSRSQSLSYTQNAKCFCFDFNVRRGGRLKGFIIWDVFSFLICLFIFLYLSYGRPNQKFWQIRSTMYLVKTLYGILSFPFIIFAVPYFTYLFTKAKETGYDGYGNCVPRVKDLKQYHKDKMKRHLLKQQTRKKDAENDESNRNLTFYTLLLDPFDMMYIRQAEHHQQIVRKQTIIEQFVMNDLIEEENKGVT